MHTITDLTDRRFVRAVAWIEILNKRTEVDFVFESPPATEGGCPVLQATHDSRLASWILQDHMTRGIDVTEGVRFDVQKDNVVTRERPLPRCAPGYGALQVAELGLKIGDTIVGKETYYNETGWNECKLLLVAVTSQTAVWREWIRTNRDPEWQERPREATGWNLEHRDWRLIESYTLPQPK